MVVLGGGGISYERSTPARERVFALPLVGMKLDSKDVIGIVTVFGAICRNWSDGRPKFTHHEVPRKTF